MSEEGGRPFIGCRITLISKSDIRYEGTLHDIDAAKATVALRNGEISRVLHWSLGCELILILLALCLQSALLGARIVL